MGKQHVYSDNFGGLPAEERMQTRMAALEYEREKRAGKDGREGVAFYDRLIAKTKAKGHVCDFPADNNFKCPTCGEAL